MIRLIKFLTVGASGAVLGFTTLWVLTEFAGLYYLVSYAVAFILSVINNYVWNSLWTFKAKQNATGFSKYLAISSATLCLNLLLMYLLTDILGIWYMLSVVIVTMLVFLVNFIMSKKYVWGENIVQQINK